MKIIITGAGGMLAQDVLDVFSDLDVIGFKKEELNICDEDNLKKILLDNKPYAVINCAAFTKVDLCESEKDKAFQINAHGPEILARLCAEVSCKLIQISTDYVFDGTANTPYSEDTLTNPINIYGQSKLAGEENIKNSTEDYLIIRTSWLFGKGGPNFIHTIIKLAHEKDKLQIVNDQRGCPTFTRDLAKGIRHLLENNATGIFNVTNTGACTWFDLARFVFEKKGIKIKIEPVDSNKFKRPARRPHFSVLSSKKYRTLVKSPLRHWHEAVEDFLF